MNLFQEKNSLFVRKQLYFNCKKSESTNNTEKSKQKKCFYQKNTKDFMEKVSEKKMSESEMQREIVEFDENDVRKRRSEFMDL